MKKDTYRSIQVNDLDEADLRDQFQDESLVLAVDVAKTQMYAGLGGPDGTPQEIVNWTHPTETSNWFSRVETLNCRDVTLVLEPTGTYGDPLISEATRRGWSVEQVSPKRVKDASEVYDGVPSQHDPKAAVVLLWLYGQGLSRPVRRRSEAQTMLKAHLEPVKWIREDKQRYQQRLSAKLAKYWPEVVDEIETDSATLLRLLTDYGGPRAVAASSATVARKMREIGGARLKNETVQAVIDGAQSTVGTPMTPAQREGIKRLACRVDELRKERRRLTRRLTDVIDADPELRPVWDLGEVVGIPTAGILWDELGDFRHYEAPKKLIKALGLNLKEHSSGTKQGRLSITKRGSSAGREALYMATLRLIQQDRWFARWHDQKVAREGGENKKKSVIALMRKLTKGLWHVARGREFQSEKLFGDDLLSTAA